jgi:uncharacterized membrane protein (UPF0127 family)
VAWLLREGDVLASLDLARTWRARSKGLLGRDGIEGALWIEPARQVHTLGMRFPIDVAFCNRDGVVLRKVTLRPYRVSLPVLKARAVVEAEAGTFSRWNLKVGDTLEVKE